ncbi:MAG: hypothetical protein OQL16_12305 [Gammaproteobacteria bacterium]|nr:hypothetical protein [Gammaproteobacteria bacterium]
MINRIHLFVVLILGLTIIGCNAPPLYNKNAREFLQEQGFEKDVISKLTTRQPLDAGIAEQLSQYENINVLHLLGANPGTPPYIIDRLAKHEHFEVRTGVATNPNAPLELLLSFRSKGEYTSVNNALARNPRLSPSTIWEMYENGEAGHVSFGLNPNCPPKLMRIIANEGNETARAWLATNRNLTGDVMQKLAQDESKLVRNYLARNSTYKNSLDRNK